MFIMRKAGRKGGTFLQQHKFNRPQIVQFEGRRPNGFLGLSLNDRTNLFLVILLDKTVSVG